MSLPLQQPLADLTPDEASELCAQIRSHLGNLRRAVLELHDRFGWMALGYASWEACVTSEFARDRSTLFEHLQAGRIERELNESSPDVRTDEVATYKLVALAPLEATERLEVVRQVDLATVSVRALRQEIKQRQRGRVGLARAKLLEGPGPDAAGPRLEEVFAVERADCARLPAYAEGADLMVTSPPYGLGVAGSDEAADTDWPAYMLKARFWAESLYETLGNGGRLCLNVPLDRTVGSREPVYADWVGLLQRVGFRYETTIVWKEDTTTNHQARGSVGSPNAPHAIAPIEMIIVAYRGEWNLQQPQRPSDIDQADWMAWLSGTWSFAGEHRHRVGHFAPFPEELARRCILLFSFPGALVADPFVGSGTTAVAAIKLGRRFRGSDIDPECVELTRRRVAAEVERHGDAASLP